MGRSVRGRPRWALSVAAVMVLMAGATALAAGTGTVDPPPRVAFVARGDVAADALAVGPIAGRLGAPVFTTSPTELVAAARDGLVDWAPEVVIVAGGPVAIDDRVIDQIVAATGLAPADVRRVSGADRFETAQRLADLIGEFDPAFLPVDATAVDADLLDGIDSTQLVSLETFATAPRVVTGPGNHLLPTTDYVDVATSVPLVLPDACPGDLEARWDIETHSSLRYSLGFGAADTQAVEQRHALSDMASTSFRGAMEMPILDVVGDTSVTGVALFSNRPPGEYVFKVQAIGRTAILGEPGDDVRTTSLGGQTAFATARLVACAVP